MSTAFDSAAGSGLPLSAGNTPELQVASSHADEMNMRELDAMLERSIEAARVAMTEALDDATRRHWCDEMGRLIGQRSQPQRDRMADAKGLPR